MTKTSELVERFSAASQRYEAVLKKLETRRNLLKTQKEEEEGQYFYKSSQEAFSAGSDALPWRRE